MTPVSVAVSLDLILIITSSVAGVIIVSGSYVLEYQRFGFSYFNRKGCNLLLAEAPFGCGLALPSILEIK
jgi:hypothetical protein